jgi:hypothetical protein
LVLIFIIGGVVVVKEPYVLKLQGTPFVKLHQIIKSCNEGVASCPMIIMITDEVVINNST